jgi:FMN phosphatase YigB (HAD superfamily)
MIKAVLFDFDGVIEDNYEKHFELSKKQIKDLTREEHRKLFEGNIHIERQKLKPRLTGFDLPKHFNEHKSKLKTKAEIKEALNKLSKKFILGIISSGLEE